MELIIYISGTNLNVSKARESKEQEILYKKDFEPKTLARTLKYIRKGKYNPLRVHIQSIETQHNLFLLKCLSVLTGIKNIEFSDDYGFNKKIHFVEFILIDIPLFLLAIIYSLLIISIFFCTCFVLYFLTKFKIKLKHNLKRTICYLKTDFWYNLKAGGSVTHTEGVINSMMSLGYNTMVISVDPLYHYELSTKVDVVKPSKLLNNLPQKLSQIEYNFRFIACSLNSIRKNKPFIIYQRNSTNNLSGALLSVIFRVPFVLEFNSSSDWISRNWKRSKFNLFEKICEYFNLECAYRISVVSKELLNTLVSRGIKKDKIIINPNGVNVNKFNSSVDSSIIKAKFPVGKTIIGFVGIFGKWHGVLTLVESVKYVANKEKEIHFVIIGEGNLKAEMIDILTKVNCQDFVTFVGLVPHREVPSYLNACDILISPHEDMDDGSIFFGSPTKIFEYMCMEKGIVVTNTGQLKEIFINENNAIMVEQKNARKLADGIVKLVRDKELRKRLGRNARKTVLQNYLWEHNVKRILDEIP